MIFKSKHFLLRPFKVGDEESLVKNLNNVNVTKNLLRVSYPYLLKHAKRWIDYNLKLDRSMKRKEMNWVIEINSEVAGSIGFTNISRDKAELAYWLGERYWGQGIMVEAINLLLKYGFRQFKFKKISAEVFSFNKNSKRVLIKTGFKYEGLLKKESFKKGKYYDHVIFSRGERD